MFCEIKVTEPSQIAKLSPPGCMFFNEQTGEYEYLDEESFSGEGYSGPAPDAQD